MKVCVSPDYVIVTRKHQDALVESLVKAYKQFYPEGPLAKTSSYSSIVNPSHFEAIQGLLKSTKAEKIIGGSTEGSKCIEPTIFKNVSLDDPLMRE